MREKLNYFMNVYYQPLLGIVVSVEIAVFTIGWYQLSTTDFAEADKLIATSSLTLLATFTGILIPLWINRNLENNANNRILKDSLGLISSEMRKNRFILKQIAANFKFSLMLQQLEFPDAIRMVHGKYKFVHSSTKLLSNEAFVASQNSGAFSLLKSDKIINAISNGYDNITSFKLNSLLTHENLSMKVYLFRNTPEPITTTDIEIYKAEIESILKKTYGELDYCVTFLDETIKLLEDELKILGINSSRFLRNVAIPADVP